MLENRLLCKYLHYKLLSGSLTCYCLTVYFIVVQFMQFYTKFTSPLGPITLTAVEEGISVLYLKDHIAIDDYIYAPARFEAALAQLSEYFAAQRQVFTLTLAPSGTAFQKLVWQALLQILYGQTATAHLHTRLASHLLHALSV